MGDRQHQAVPRTGAERRADVDGARQADDDHARDVERHAPGPAVEVRREVEAVEEVVGAADDQRVHDRADARALAERRREHEHDERRRHHDGAERDARDVGDGRVEDVPRPEADAGAHRQQLAVAVQQQPGGERGEAHAGTAAQGRMWARHAGIMAARHGDMLSLQARQPRGRRGREESPDTEGQGAG